MQLSFNQKVGLGFAIIILLLMASGMASLYTLWTIEGSTTRVNEEAVPILKESNRVQIQLLKLAKLSSLAFNAPDRLRSRCREIRWHAEKSWNSGCIECCNTGKVQCNES
jgi:hypothetical protein